MLSSTSPSGPKIVSAEESYFWISSFLPFHDSFSYLPAHYTQSAVLCLVPQWCSRVWLSVTPWTIQPARLLRPWRFSRQEYWSGLPCPPPGDLPNPRIKHRSPPFQVDSLPAELQGSCMYIPPLLYPFICYYKIGYIGCKEHFVMAWINDTLSKSWY